MFVFTKIISTGRTSNTAGRSESKKNALFHRHAYHRNNSFAATNIDDIFVLTLFFSQTPRRWPVVFGQYLGFTALIAISLAGFFGGRILPHEWIRFFGLVPIAIGIKKLLVKPDDHLKRGGGVSALDVALVTFANGGDNIGIYAPLFAISTAAQLIELLVVFYLLLAVWCVVGYFIPRHQAVASALKRCGHWLVPLVLVGLGLYILSN
jgi:cadmium resistance protein CadD (predicted permease)